MSLPSHRALARRGSAAALLLGLAAGLVWADSPKDAPKETDKGAAAPADAATDKKVMAEVKAHFSTMKNLQHLCDEIGPRMTGSANLKKANDWTAEKMKEYGLRNVHLEPWEIPVGWERGAATFKMVEPNAGKSLTVAAAAWTPGTKGKITGPVVYIDAKTKDDVAKYKGKLKGAVVLTRPPTPVSPINDLNYLGTSSMSAPKPEQKKDEPKKDEPKPEPKKDEVKKDEPKKDAPKDEAKKDPPQKDPPPPASGQPPVTGGQPPAGGGGGRGPQGEFMAMQQALTELLRSEGVGLLVRDSGKPHGLLMMTGGWPRNENAPEPLPAVYITHEDYAMLYRMATTKDGPQPKVEVETTCKFVPGPITVYNTVGELPGTDKADEFVVVGAHLDSWDLGTGATDNGTGSCTVLEVARTLAALSKEGVKPRRTVRFCLFSGEEQGLYGSKAYVAKHKDEMPKTSVALVHDTGTGKVMGFGLQGREAVQKVLAPELESLKELDGWKGLSLKSLGGSDHQSFENAGVPGFACDQDMDEYRLTHHTQTDTFDHAKEPNLIEGAQAMAVTALRIADMPELLPRDRPTRGPGGGPGGGGRRPTDPPAGDKKPDEPKKDEPKKDEKKPDEPKK